MELRGNRPIIPILIEVLVLQVVQLLHRLLLPLLLVRQRGELPSLLQDLLLGRAKSHSREVGCGTSCLFFA